MKRINIFNFLKLKDEFENIYNLKRNLKIKNKLENESIIFTQKLTLKKTLPQYRV